MADREDLEPGDLGQRLREARLRAGLTQKDLADAGFTASYISQVERGVVTPSVTALGRLAQKLGRGLGELFEDSTLPEKRHGAQFNLDMGQLSLELGSPREAGDYLEAAVRLSREASLVQLEIRSLLARGWSRAGEKRQLDAVADMTAALEKATASQSSDLIRLCCRDLGRLYLDSGNPLMAVQYLRQADSESGGKGCALTLYSLSRCYASLGEERLAQEFLDRAVVSARRYAEWESAISHLARQARDLWEAGEREQALDLARRARHLSSYRKDMALAADLLREAAWISESKGEMSRSRSLLRAALELSRGVGDQSGQIRIRRQLSRMLLSSGDLEGALTQAQSARELAENLKGIEMAKTQYLLGKIEAKQENAESAQAHWEESLDLYRRAGHVSRAAQVAADIGELCLASGNQTKALRFFRLASELRRED